MTGAPADPNRPTLVTRLVALFRAEVSAGMVEAYRRAGKVAYDDLIRAERLRDELAGRGIDLWSATTGQRSQLLCTWNAFVSQSLGDELVEADYRADPRTVGFLPPVTAEQAAAFLGEVEHWSARAHRAAADPNYDVADEQVLPAPLPRWVEVEPCPQPHLDAMLAAARSVRDHAEAALGTFLRAGIPTEHAKDAARLKGVIADADSSVSYAESLWTRHADQTLHERVEASLKRAIETYHRAGQLLAMPTLLDRPEIQASVLVPARLPLPGQPGFDPWCLTDPASRPRWQRDPLARKSIDLLWRYDPDPAATLRIQAEIDAATATGAITSGVGPDGTRIGHYFCCPWSPVHVVRHPVVIGGQSLRAGEQFIFDVSAEEMAEGGEFTRQLVLGPFHHTEEIDYCDPTEGGHDD